MASPRMSIRFAGGAIAVTVALWTTLATAVVGAAPPAKHTPASSRSLDTTTELPATLPGYRVYRPADLDATGARLPVIVWANGGCVWFDGIWAPLLERWAAAGFFVVATAESPPDLAQVSTAEDQAAAIDWALQQNKKAAGPYAGHLDVERVVAAGNSCGGITSLGLAGQDDRVKAVFVLSGSSVGPGASREAAAAVMSRVRVPVGFAVGGPEDIAASQADQDYDLLPDGVPGYVAHRSEGNHPTVSTTASILEEEVAEISVRFIDLALYGTKSARRELLDNPCPSCAPDTWSVTAKHLNELEPTRR